MTFTAKYPGSCRACFEGIVPGESVDYTDDRHLVHTLCPDETDMHGKPLQICPRCFMAIPVSGACGVCE